jgi:hypothetical protein
MATWIKAVMRVVGAFDAVLFLAGLYFLFRVARWGLFAFVVPDLYPIVSTLALLIARRRMLDIIGAD